MIRRTVFNSDGLPGGTSRVIAMFLSVCALLFPALVPMVSFGQCYQSGNIIRPYGCDYIVELPPIVQGGPVTRCYTLDPQSTNIQPGLVSVQSSGCVAQFV